MVGKISALAEGGYFKTPPIWMMRQAGRYLPEYRLIRASSPNFLELCYSPKKAADITLQPIGRFDFDAAIIFADILLVADSLGTKVEFKNGDGPVLSPIRNKQELSTLKINPRCPKLSKIGETVSLVKSRLGADKDLIGFIGAPWSVAAYMVEGGTRSKFELIKSYLYKDAEFLSELIDIITEQSINYLKMQIDAGCTVVKIFDSWAGVLPVDEFYKFSILPTAKIVSSIKSYRSDVSIIGFPREAGYMYEDYIKQTGIDIIAFDSKVPLQVAHKWQDELPVQGNLDPSVLMGSREVIAEKLDKIMDNLAGKRFIFNLGHGIVPGTPIENVGFTVDYIRNYEQKKNSSSTV